MNNLQHLQIRHFRLKDQDEAKTLILAGLAEHWGWLDSTKNPDLDSIAHSYAAGIFLVACWQGQLVGTGALIPEKEGVGRIVRMSVAKPYRRRGVGQTILQQLQQEARGVGYRTLVLETTLTWPDAVDFYNQAGFETIGYCDDERYFSLDLYHKAIV